MFIPFTNDSIIRHTGNTTNFINVKYHFDIHVCGDNNVVNVIDTSF